jgi:hypothetical protein
MGEATELVQDIAFYSKPVDLFPLAIGDYYHQAIMGHPADHSFQEPELLIFGWDHDCHPAFKIPKRFLIYLFHPFGTTGTGFSSGP